METASYPYLKPIKLYFITSWQEWQEPVHREPVPKGIRVHRLERKPVHKPGRRPGQSGNSRIAHPFS